jgi:hypothetical protein
MFYFIVLMISPLALISFGLAQKVSFACSKDSEKFQTQPFCLPSNYSKQDRPNADNDHKMDIFTGD